MKGSYLNTRGIGILESEKIKLDGSPAELKENPLKFLKKAKLKNLHEFINENDIDISINNTNKESILVRFLNE